MGFTPINKVFKYNLNECLLLNDGCLIFQQKKAGIPQVIASIRAESIRPVVFRTCSEDTGF